MRSHSFFGLEFWAKWVLGVMIIAGVASRAEIDPKYYAVMASAKVQTSPAQITLEWARDDRATGYTVARKNGGSWNNIATLGGGTTSYTDSNVSVGGTYEYRITKSSSAGYKGTGYVYAGINAPLVDQRGKVILVVDNTYAADLATELQRLEWDLAGDGWIVLRRDVSRNASVPEVKNVIKSAYQSDPANVKAVFLFGHIAVPYSGDFNPDGHPDHKGAWAADLYYGDMDGNWTDSSVHNTGGHRPANHNVPGDGKFDQSDMPSDVELAVGRVDLSNMTCFSNKSWSRSEKDLLRAYLNKDHAFRHRHFTVERRGLVCDNFGERDGEAFASSGWRNFASMFGADKVSSVPGWQYFPTVGSNGYLWSYGTGGGSYYTCNGVGGSDDFANTEVQTVFTMFLGSYFGDWDNESNFLRAPLGSGKALTTSWAGRPHWFYHHMALGETIGHSTVLSQNNRYGGMYEGQNYGTRQVHAALLGDPTLRMHPVIPVSNLQGQVSGGSITLSWNPSTDGAIQGYHVYRGSNPGASFTRLTGSPISATSFTDNTYSGGTYMVRAVRLETSGSGTYFNASQGVFFPANGTGGGSSGGGTGGSTGGTPNPGPQVPAAPAELAAVTASASQVNLTWSDRSENETGFRVERRQGTSGSWQLAATVPSNITSYANSGLAPATEYSFRVLAYNEAGNSPASGEVRATTSAGVTTAAAATFLGLDPAPQGDWQGVYGTDGYQVITGDSALPGYVTVSPSGKADYQWSKTTSDVRALEPVSGGGRIAGCWYAPDSFEVALNFKDGNTHRLAFYFLDWDRTGRSQKVEILDAASGQVLHSQTLSNFQEGIYATYNVKGSIRARFTHLSGPNAVLMGLFFDPQAISGQPSASTKPGGLVSGKFQLQISGEPGQKFEIYSSEDLKTWTKLETVTLESATYDFLDTASTGKAIRFYRAVAVP